MEYAVLIIIGLLFFALGLVLVGIYLIFARFSKLTNKTFATLKHSEHLKNVHLRHSSKPVQNYTKCIYLYTVNNRTYKKRTEFHRTPGQVPFKIPTVYIKFFPRISYLDHSYDLGPVLYLICGIAFIILAIMYTFLTFAV